MYILLIGDRKVASAKTLKELSNIYFKKYQGKEASFYKTVDLELVEVK